MGDVNHVVLNSRHVCDVIHDEDPAVREGQNSLLVMRDVMVINLGRSEGRHGTGGQRYRGNIYI